MRIYDTYAVNFLALLGRATDLTTQPRRDFKHLRLVSKAGVPYVKESSMTWIPLAYVRLFAGVATALTKTACFTRSRVPGTGIWILHSRLHCLRRIPCGGDGESMEVG
jgi:hypothetical protein